MTCRILGCDETKKGWGGSLDKCSNCYKSTCPNHLIILQRHHHLFEGDSDESINLLCKPCAEDILHSNGKTKFPLYTQTNIDCTKKDCKNSHSLLCGGCGHRFCKEHLISKMLFDDHDWQGKVQFSIADGICEQCLESVNLLPKDGCGVLSKEQLVLFESFGLKVLRHAKKYSEEGFRSGALLILFVGKLLKEKTLSKKHLNHLSQLAKYSISDLELLPSHLHPKATYVDDMFFFAQYFMTNISLQKGLEDSWKQFSSMEIPLFEVCQALQSIIVEANESFQKAATLLTVHHNKWPLKPNIVLSEDKENQNNLPQLLQINSATEKDIVIFVHGFLGANSDHTHWKNQIQRYMQRPASHFIYRWKADYTEDVLCKVGLGGSVLGSTAEKANVAMMSLLSNVGSDTGARYYWQQCRENTDFQVLQLVALLQREVFQDCRITLVGHSLGGRVALKAAEYCGKIVNELGMPAVQLRSVVALAPVIQDNELDWDMVRKGVSQKPEVFYSNEDLVLSLLFRAGEGMLSPLVGFQGANSSTVFNIDCSRFGLGHDDYVGSWGKVFRNSNSILRCY